MAPERIVSLVPSLTEALFAFGVGERVVGRTRYCTQPPQKVGKIPKVGGTKKVSVPRVLDLEPDLIVAVREENPRENIEELREAGIERGLEIEPGGGEVRVNPFVDVRAVDRLQ